MYSNENSVGISRSCAVSFRRDSDQDSYSTERFVTAQSKIRREDRVSPTITKHNFILADREGYARRLVQHFHARIPPEVETLGRHRHILVKTIRNPKL